MSEKTKTKDTINPSSKPAAQPASKKTITKTVKGKTWQVVKAG
jgi:hypothetical protein